MEPIFSPNSLVLTIFLGSGGICKIILHLDVSRGLQSQKTPILSHFTREFGQKLRAIALGGPTTPKSKISLQIIYKCTKPLIPSVKFRGHRTFFSWFFCNKKVAFLTSCWRSIFVNLSLRWEVLSPLSLPIISLISGTTKGNLRRHQKQW